MSATPAPATSPAISRRVWLMILAGAATVSLAMGVRQVFGLFLTPLGIELGIDRQTFGLIIAVQNLIFGAVQPLVGAYADKHGAGKVAVVGTLIYLAGLAVAATAMNALGLMIGFGLMVGIAMSGVTFVVVLGAVGRAVPAEKRTLAFGIVTAGGSLGQFLMVPLTQGLLDAYGWRAATWILTATLIALIPLALGLAGKPPASAAKDGLPFKSAMKEALSHPSFMLLNLGFFVCGFHIAFVGTHLPSFLRDQGLSPSIGAMSLTMIGLFNILGSWLWGAWGGKYSKKALLAGLYSARSVVILIFLLMPVTPITAIVFASVFGFLWLGTVPLTNGLVAQIYGVRHLSALCGIVFFAHQIGAFLGAWLGGIVFDATQSYNLIWYISIGLGLVAAVANLPIKETAIQRPQPVTAP